jgi:hypothetical protein
MTPVVALSILSWCMPYKLSFPREIFVFLLHFRISSSAYLSGRIFAPTATYVCACWCLRLFLRIATNVYWPLTGTLISAKLRLVKVGIIRWLGPVDQHSLIFGFLRFKICFRFVKQMYRHLLMCIFEWTYTLKKSRYILFTKLKHHIF